MYTFFFLEKGDTQVTRIIEEDNITLCICTRGPILFQTLDYESGWDDHFSSLYFNIH